MRAFKGRTALITGASSGIGRDCATLLAEAGCNLILVARREDRLQVLKNELNASYGVQVDIIVADLSQPGSANSLFDRTRKLGLEIDVLINNAGYGKHGHFLDVPLATQIHMLQLLTTTVTELTHLFAEQMKQRGQGYILQIASIAAYSPTPTFASYGAAKAYVLNFGVALAKELKPHGVQVTVLSPGGTLTEFMDISGQDMSGMRSKMMMPSHTVAKAGLKALARGRTTVVPGCLYKTSIASLRLFSRNAQARIAESAVS